MSRTLLEYKRDDAQKYKHSVDNVNEVLGLLLDGHSENPKLQPSTLIREISVSAFIPTALSVEANAVLEEVVRLFPSDILIESIRLYIISVLSIRTPRT